MRPRADVCLIGAPLGGDRDWMLHREHHKGSGGAAPVTATTGPETFTPPGEPSEEPISDSDDTNAGCPPAAGLLLQYVECSRSEPVTPRSRAPRPPDSVNSDNPYQYTVEEYLEFIPADVDPMWVAGPPSQGLAAPTVWVSIVGVDQTITSCSVDEDVAGNDTVRGDYPNALSAQVTSSPAARASPATAP